MKCPYCLIGDYEKYTELEYMNCGDKTTNDVLVNVEHERCSNCDCEPLPEDIIEIPKGFHDYQDLECLQEYLCDSAIDEKACKIVKDCVTCIFHKTNFKYFVEKFGDLIDKDNLSSGKK